MQASRTLLLSLLIASAASMAGAQGFFVDETVARLPAVIDEVYQCDFVDVDNDADLDIFCVDNSGAGNELWINDGNGFYADESAARLPAVGNNRQALRFASGDVDADGDQDLVIANLFANAGRSSRTQLWLNDGSGVFTDGSLQLGEPEELDTSVASSTAGIDVFDSLVADFSIFPFVRLGGWVTDPATAPVGESFSFPVELTVAGALTVDGSFQRATDAGIWQMKIDGVDLGAPIDLYDPSFDLPTLPIGAVALAAGPHTVTFELVGQNALAVANFMYLNSLTFTSGGGAQTVDIGSTSFSRDVDLNDFDNDTDLDIMVGNVLFRDRLLLNDGAGSFTDVSDAQLFETFGSTHNLEGGDFDGDGDLDVLSLNEGGRLELFLNNGGGFFLGDAVADSAAAGFTANPTQAHGGAVGDFSGDGNTDVFMAVRDGAEANLLYFGDGAGNYVDMSGNLPAGVLESNDADAADIDADGDLDLIVANGNPNIDDVALSQLLINDGAGVFVDEANLRGLPLIEESNTYGAFGDVDGDGDMDLLIATEPSQNRLLINVGSGTPEERADGLCAFIQSLPESAFKAPAQNRKNALCNKLEAVKHQIVAGAIAGAINKLERDFLSKMDSSIGGKANDDWITDEVIQGFVIPRVQGLIDAIAAL